ncbi:hypothetical protein ACFV2X_28385 [Streptomyces sp. NPDC059679]|uniref:hypothetical protein n=1 Tax=Streptomyces sp. NPDC059679 TaxID=3346903 RepID=UPI003676CDDC
MAACDEVAVPTQYRVGAYEQPWPAQDVQWQPVQQRCQECPIARREPDLVLAELAFQHGDLMAQGEDLGVLVPVGHRQQAKHRKRVRHAQVSPVAAARSIIMTC